MQRTVRLWAMLVLSALAGLLLAACSGAAAPMPTARSTQSPTETPPEPGATAVGTATMAAAPTEDVSADIAALRPAAPAAEEADFRPDPVAVVAATGRPQLIEVFSYD